ncbi:hypothetical protein [Streptomyces mobaraensis]|uniref:Uncharacterized protein n=1 Tax=Streptomyces mobaraensis TaxID=35621 RepID=A0A5N5WCX9_STRMB|nr:hypothetical protein [Streptomyces mobaraensis]KAB7850196.1 hypothetical protein FRZ00_06250 [Streptomyces mobaraensis]
MEDRQPVTGPFRIYVQPSPGGVEIDVSHLVAVLLVQLARDFEDDQSGVGQDLLDIAEADRNAVGADSAAGHERDELVQQLMTEIGGGVVPVYGPQVLRLAERLRSLASPKSVPQQRNGEAA